MNQIGVLIAIKGNGKMMEEFERIRDCGFTCCQLKNWNMSLYTDEVAEDINRAVAATGITVSTLWAGWSGPKEWNFTGGPATLGLVPAAYRMKRAEEVLTAVDFAEKIGVKNVATHVGFLPEDMHDNNYADTLAILRHIVKYCAAKEINFLFETGQETPVTLLRAIEDLNSPYVGINMDTANLILYGKANSVDAIRVFGKYVKDTHIKDGFYPTDGQNLGLEVKVGTGLANIPEVARMLKELGYTGTYIIERELKGNDAQKDKDILETLDYLKNVLKEI